MKNTIKKILEYDDESDKWIAWDRNEYIQLELYDEDLDKPQLIELIPKKLITKLSSSIIIEKNEEKSIYDECDNLFTLKDKLLKQKNEDILTEVKNISTIKGLLRCLHIHKHNLDNYGDHMFVRRLKYLIIDKASKFLVEMEK